MVIIVPTVIPPVHYGGDEKGGGCLFTILHTLITLCIFAIGILIVCAGFFIPEVPLIITVILVIFGGLIFLGSIWFFIEFVIDG